MKKTLLLLALTTAALAAPAQQKPAAPAAGAPAAAAPAGYAEMLESTVAALMSTGEPAALKEAVARLERAAAAAPADWLPRYYQAYAQTLLAFVSKDPADTKDRYLDQADAYLDQARKLGGDASEVLVLRAYLYQARLSVAPMTRALVYPGKVTEALAAAKAQNPANPRIYLVQGNNLYYTPAMFGGGAAAAKPSYDEAKVRFAAFRPASRTAPNWGERQLLARLKQYEVATATPAGQ